MMDSGTASDYAAKTESILPPPSDLYSTRPAQAPAVRSAASSSGTSSPARRCRYCSLVLSDNGDRLYHELWRHSRAVNNPVDNSVEPLCTELPKYHILPLQTHWSMSSSPATPLTSDETDDWISFISMNRERLPGGTPAPSKTIHMHQQQPLEASKLKTEASETVSPALVGASEKEQKGPLEDQVKLLDPSLPSRLLSGMAQSMQRIPKEVFPGFEEWIQCIKVFRGKTFQRRKALGLIFHTYFELAGELAWNDSATEAMYFWETNPGGADLKEVSALCPKKKMLRYRDCYGIYHSYRVLYAALMWAWRFGIPCLGLPPRLDLLKCATEVAHRRHS